MNQPVLRSNEMGDGDQGSIATEENTEDKLSRDEIFHILRSQRRRYALHYLKHHEGPTTIGELADQLTA